MIIISPIYVLLPRKTKADKKIALNLNVFRNLNFIVNNQCKKIYTELMKPYLIGHKFNKPNITYTIYYDRWWRHDKLNVWSIVSKYFLDTLVEAWCIEDDSDEYIWIETFIYWWVDKWKGRVEINII